MLDVAMWGIQALHSVDKCLPQHISGNSGRLWLDDAKEVPDTQVLTYDYGDLAWSGNCEVSRTPFSWRVRLPRTMGHKGHATVNSRGWSCYARKARSTSRSIRPLAHGEFPGMRKEPQSSPMPTWTRAFCSLWAISVPWRNVRFDPRAEKLGDDKEANALLTKEYRELLAFHQA